jgi:outer membrane protein TolC
MKKPLLFLLLLSLPLPTVAQEPSELSLAEVLRSSARHAPQILEAYARVRQAEGKALTAEGAFDTVFDVEAQSRAAGYYDGSYVEGRATRPLTGNGGQLYGGYRVARGTFPIYEDKAYTSRAGEFRVGTLYSLLRDRAVDERRGRTALARGDLDIARLEREMVGIGVQGRAVAAYQNWVAAGLRLRAYRSLLTLAQDRRAGIGRQVQLGARPDILLVENEQNIVRRRALVVRSEQEFASTANGLSLFLRDQNGERLAPSESRLPATLPAFRVPRPVGPIARPDLRAADTRIEQSQLRLALAQNELKPRLDLRGELAYGLGATGLGGVSRDGEQAIVGLRFSMPLQRRQAQGRIADAQAEIEAGRARAKLISDQIAVEVNGIVIAAEGAERSADLAAREAELADRMADAERRRFQLGASDFFLLNLREEAATDARVRLLDAQARAALAAADLAAATGDRGRLGLVESDADQGL